MKSRLHQAVVHLHGGEPGEIEGREIVRGVERQQDRPANSAGVKYTGKPGDRQRRRAITQPEKLRLKTELLRPRLRPRRDLPMKKDVLGAVLFIGIDER